MGWACFILGDGAACQFIAPSPPSVPGTSAVASERPPLGAALERPLGPPRSKLLLLVAAAIKMLPAYGSMCCCIVAVHYYGGRLS